MAVAGRVNSTFDHVATHSINGGIPSKKDNSPVLIRAQFLKSIFAVKIDTR
jgi:hypothetical protein